MTRWPAGTESTSIVLDEWCYLRGVKLDFTRPGKPTENCFIESFNGRFRDECLNVNQFARRGQESDLGVPKF